jgi:DNA polymerase III delta prime subunit
VTPKRDRGDGTTNSRHLEWISEVARSGAHVLLRGHLHDDVLWNREILVEEAGLARTLVEGAGIRSVLVANQTDGTFCVEGEEEDSFEEFFAELSPEGEIAPQLDHTHPMGVARTIRLLLRQQQRPVAILLEGAADLFTGDSEQSREALGILLEGMAEAAFHRNSSHPRRNVLIVHGVPDGVAVERIATLPGVEEVTVESPNRDERLIALRDLKREFYRGGNGGRPASEDLEIMASLTQGYSLRSLQQLARTSHAVETPATRPETLFRRARREDATTALGKVGVGTIMEKLRREILGQEQALDVVEAKLSLGRWRPANRAPGSRSTRPMVTLVLHGPPGVGKTETAQVLAEAMLGSRAALHRIDCSEYRQRHDVARLTGAPPGYVGYEEGGALTEVLAREAAVIVFDEFDRGPGLSEMLLGVLDAGRLTDGRGRTATFENAVLLFTTNRGFRTDEGGRVPRAEEVDRDTFITENQTGLEDAVIKQMGSSALWSRLRSALVGYDLLRPAAWEQIVVQSCERLARNLGDEFDIRLDFEAERLAALVVAQLPDPPDGRSIFPEVQKLIEGPLREQLAEKRGRGRLAAGTAYSVGVGPEGRAKLV